MTQLVHVQTTVQTVFGLLDDEGNVIAQQPIVASVAQFKPEGFAEAHAVIAGQRDMALANYEAEQAEAEKAKRNSRRPRR